VVLLERVAEVTVGVDRVAVPAAFASAGDENRDCLVGARGCPMELATASAGEACRSFFMRTMIQEARSVCLCPVAIVGLEPDRTRSTHVGLLDMVKGLFGSDIVQNTLESTGLNEHVEGFLGEGTAVAESLGVDADQAVETLGGVSEVLPDGFGEVVQGATEGALPDTPV
jgi:hypothetical protein